MSKLIGLTHWLLILTILISEELVEGRKIPNSVNRAIIKTIKVKSGEIIDCYDIYRQPSLNHSLLRNHTIQMQPSFDPKDMKSDNLGTLQLKQTWHDFGSCPKETIPIRRKMKNYNPTFLRKRHRTKLSHYNRTPNASQPSNFVDLHEYATVEARGNFLGAQAKINLWKPVIEMSAEISISQIWVTAAEGKETIETGWMVNRPLYGDYETRFFIYWTDTNLFCYNDLCPGFVHTSSSIGLGCSFTELSTFNGDQKDALFSIHKDQSSGHWWIQLQGESVGYYPSSLFTELSNKATTIQWGGEIVNAKSKGRHTATQMGSGHFPSEGGLKTSSYFNWVQVVDENNMSMDPKDFDLEATNPNCYDLKVDDSHRDTNGFGFYYGGPGYNDKCP
ncbi:hypothetical protein C5167_020147 [Papaver somniferum]|uniref:Neprosin PEP catalytic domain-containing protein n=1 Tax=Papaver somniferum TaxID=3469 RepID=A0A4Y7IS68_PAPSO|nr:uncharacterized protein LOC113354127 [Papaver somniferum]RZC51723.1 hypothetical protein C5167_020147 [Papaver somniferum]